MEHLPYLDAGAIRRRLSPRAAVDALAAALQRGLDPAAGVARSIIPWEHGELLLMPAEVPGAAGVKVVTVAPTNATRGLPLVQGLYVLMDSETLTPRALLDGVELTALRTPAVSLLAVRHRLQSSATPLRLVVAGTGVQAVRHVLTTIDVLRDARRIESVTYLARRPEQPAPTPIDGVTTTVTGYGSTAAEKALAGADLVVCATAAADPLFNGALLREDVTVIAVGSHAPARRELDAHLMGRARVVVEDVATAMREAGDVIQAVECGHLDLGSLVPLSRAVREPSVLLTSCPVVFKGSGMAWQDAVVAAAVMGAPTPS